MTGKAYWRSLEELADAPEFRRWLESEFPDLPWEGMSAPTRRQFLKLMGASFALAGVAGCRWPQERIAPHARPPENRTPGVPVQYATAMDLGGAAQGLLVTSYDGRPIKIEGNPSHPINRGATDAIAQAGVLELYDPDRSRFVMHRNGWEQSVLDWARFEAFVKEHLEAARARRGAGLAILTEAFASPSFARMRNLFLETFPQAQWCEYEPISRDSQREGTRLAFGRPFRPQWHIEQADVIVSFDDDFLMLHPAAVKHARDFAARRRADGSTMNRLHMIESRLSVTGGMADHRYAVRSSQIPRVVEHVAMAVAERLGRSASDSPIPRPPGSTAVSPEAVNAIAEDLVAHKGRCLVIVGPQQAPEAHAAACVLNAWLESAGRTVTYAPEPDPDRPTHMEAIAQLAGRMRDGAIDTLIVLGGNPVYNAPADVDFAEALGRVKTSIHLSLYDNETSQRCTWHVPRAHFLESWGDACAWDGTFSLVQPLIEPLYGGRSAIELLAMICGDEASGGRDIVRRTFVQRFASGPEWEKALHDGVVADSAWPVKTPALAVSKLAPSSPGSDQEVVFAPDYKVFDGRFANNAWLQELPDPITKLTWDNAALISPAQAELLGIRSGDVIRIEPVPEVRRPANVTLDAPVLIAPGQAFGSITLPLGYGRGPPAGAVAEGTGFDAYRLRTTDNPHAILAFKLTVTGKHRLLATTQDHHAIDSRVGRQEIQRRVPVLVREITLEEYRRDPHGALHPAESHTPQLLSPWKEPQFAGRPRWAMAIDLSACIGCGACVVACQAENNIPVVGRDEVARGREMHWIRVDRYFRGDPAAPQVVHQPVACHHCQNAPCEQVCPVAATVHSQEGLNDMVYNRCVGTRYCSNNCPYKVRRFNWFNNHKDQSDIEKLLMNPDVTVRSRGVMEKCTFCVQRINRVKIAAKNESRPVADGQIVPACAQACPAQAIVFGDLNDPNSQVTRLHAHERAYAMLEELNVKPRTKYLARLRNPV